MQESSAAPPKIRSRMGMNMSCVPETTGMAPGSLVSLYEEFLHREKLAEKVLAGKRLTSTEREEVYELLAGKKPSSPPPKRGRPSTIERDFELAIEYLWEKKNGRKRTDKLRKELAKKHKLSGHENTFYTALNRGIADWQRVATSWVERYHKGEFAYLPEAERERTYLLMQEGLATIEEHRRSVT